MIAADNVHARVLLPPIAAEELTPESTEVTGIVHIDLDDGGVRWHAGAEAPRPGEREVRVELRVAPEAESHPLEATRLDPDRYRIVFENEAVRIVRLGFDPGEEGQMVHHPPRALVALTDLHARMRFEDGTSEGAEAEAGQAGWLDAQTLQTANAGKDRLEVVLVEPKAITGITGEEK